MAKKLTESVAKKPAAALAKKSGGSKASKEATPPKAKKAVPVSPAPLVVASPKSISAPKSAAMRRASKGDARKGKAATNAVTNAAVDKSPSDIIYIGHIPAGFEEREMRKFFSQFGDVVRLKLVRNKKTLASRGHAFVKFESVETANTVSESMNGYFIGERQLVSHVVPAGKVHEGMLRTGARSNASKARDGVVSEEGSRKRKAGTDADSSDSENDDETASFPAPKAGKNKIGSSMRKKQKKLDALGMGYDFLAALKSNTAANTASRKQAAAAKAPEPPVEEEAEAAPAKKAAPKKAAPAETAAESEASSKASEKKGKATKKGKK